MISTSVLLKDRFYSLYSSNPSILETIEDIPCLLIWGDQDNVIPKKNSEDFKKALVKAKYEIVENVGHAPFVEKTSIVYEKLRSFLT